MLTSERVPSPPARRRSRSGLTRQQIVEASRHLFSTRGYAATTVREIAREAGISDAAIYYHFQTKSDVLDALIDADLAEPPEDAPAGADRSPADVIYERLVHTTGVIENNLELLTIILREALAENPHAVRRYRRIMEGWERSLARALEGPPGPVAMSHGAARRLARQIVYATSMALQDAFVLCRPRVAGAEERRRRMLSSLRRSLDWLLPVRKSVTGA